MAAKYVNQMTWQEYAEKTEDSILIIPVGSTEQHSTHLPLGADSIIPEGFVKEFAKHMDCVVAPTIHYGAKSQPTSGGGPLFPGTVDLSGTTMICLIKDILEEFIRDGWKKILIFSGHFENEPFIAEAADLITRGQKADFPRIALINWWSFMDDEMIPKLFDEVAYPGIELEHAAIFETSLIMYFKPELVREDKIVDTGIEKAPPYQQFPPIKNLIPDTGTLHTARTSSREKGKMLVKNVVKNFCSYVDKIFC